MRFPSAKQAVSSFAAILTARKLGCRPICGCPAASPPESCSRRSHPQAPRLRSHQVPQHPRRVSALDGPAAVGYGPPAFQPLSAFPSDHPLPLPGPNCALIQKIGPPAVLIFVPYRAFCGHRCRGSGWASPPRLNSGSLFSHSLIWAPIYARREISGPKFALAPPLPLREFRDLREWKSVGCGPPP